MKQNKNYKQKIETKQKEFKALVRRRIEGAYACVRQMCVVVCPSLHIIYII